MQVFRDSEYGMSIRDMFCDIHYKKALDPGIFIIFRHRMVIELTIRPDFNVLDMIFLICIKKNSICIYFSCSYNHFFLYLNK